MENIRKVKTLDTNTIRQVSPTSSAKAGAESLVVPPPQQEMPIRKSVNYVAVLVIILSSLVLGAGSGYAARQVGGATGNPTSTTQADNKTVVISENEAGVDNSEAFPDSAVGVLMEGGKDGEGTHYLDRGMGADKYVYLTSTVINMQKFVGKNVEVRGQTLSARKAGWLMDVGRIKVVQ